MVAYTLEQRWEILRFYFENHGNVAEYVRKLHTCSYVRYLVKKVKETGILSDKPKCEKPKSQKPIILPSFQMGKLHKFFFEFLGAMFL